MILYWNLDISTRRVLTFFLVAFKSIGGSICWSIGWSVCRFDTHRILTFKQTNFSGCVWLLWFLVNWDHYCLRFFFISRFQFFCGLSNSRRLLLMMRERPSLWWWILTVYRWDRDHWWKHASQSSLFVFRLLFFKCLFLVQPFGLSLLFLEDACTVLGCLCCVS